MATSAAEEALGELGKRITAICEELERARERLEEEGNTAAAATTTTTTVAENTANNPIGLLKRARKLQHETLPEIRRECERIVAAKQHLVDSCRAVAMANRCDILALQSAAGVPQLPVSGPLADLLVTLEDWDRESGIASVASEKLTLSIVKTSSSHQQQQQQQQQQQPQQQQEEQPQQKQQQTAVATETAARAQRRSATHYEAVSEEEFEKVSTVVRGRCKLDDVNAVYRIVFDAFNNKAAPRDRDSPITTAELGALGCKVVGLSGESKLATLRSLRILDVTKRGVTLLPRRNVAD